MSALNTANNSIQVPMFAFTNATIAQALIAAKNRGVAVEVLLETVSAGSQFSQRDDLCAAGVTVRVEDFAGRLHDKYAVVDANTSSDPLVITGSTNWTAGAVEANDENLLIVHDAGLASAFTSDFARLRSAISPNAFACNTGSFTTPTVANYLPLIKAGRSADHLDQTATAQALTATAGPTASSTATPSPTSTATSTQLPSPGIAIISILYDPPDTLSEYVQIRNAGATAVDMTNWTLRDLANNTYTFPPFTLAAGAEVKVWTNSGVNDAANLYWGRGQAVWNNTGDTAILRNAQGAEISRFSY